MSKTLSRDDLLDTSSFKREPVEIPSRGGRVYVRQLSWLAVADQGADDESEAVITAKMVARSLVDENGKRLLGDDDWSEFSDSLAPKEFKSIMEAVQRLNALGGLPEGN